MLTVSIAHAFQFVLQYMAFVMAIFLYQWMKDIRQSLRHTHVTSHSIQKSSNRRFPVYSRRLLIIGQWIRDYRQEYGLTQERLAEKMHVDVRTIQRWESGVAKPQPRHWLTIFRVLFSNEYTQIKEHKINFELLLRGPDPELDQLLSQVENLLKGERSPRLASKSDIDDVESLDERSLQPDREPVRRFKWKRVRTILFYLLWGITILVAIVYIILIILYHLR